MICANECSFITAYFLTDIHESMNNFYAEFLSLFGLGDCNVFDMAGERAGMDTTKH